MKKSMFEGAREEGKIEGMAEERAVGKAEEMKEIAKNALRKGADISFIVEITGLKEEDVTTLKDEMDNQ